jgi:Big-like domain-containing protein
MTRILVRVVAARSRGHSWIHVKGGRVVVCVLAAVALCSATAARATTFSYTGGEQTYTVPVGVRSVSIVAIGGPGGGPAGPGGTPGGPEPGGRAAEVSGVVDVAPGEVLYVEVGGTGGRPAGGFNGGGPGGTAFGSSVFGGGGASDVRLISSSADGSLVSRLIVAGGGGGSSFFDTGGDAGAPGIDSGDPSIAAGAGTQNAGGAGGCGETRMGCGGDGSLGVGGAGGSSGTGGDAREGGGGGGGLFGGGGGVGNVTDGIGSGGGGSSKLPPDLYYTMSLASLTTPPSVTITPVPAPSCEGAALRTPFGRPLVVQLWCMEYAAKPLTYRVVVPPAHGTLSAVRVVGPAGQVVYKPAVGFSGIDSFTYDASSTNGTSNVKMISITVGPNPVGVASAGRGRANNTGVEVPVACTGALGAHCRLTVAMTERDMNVGRRSVVIPARTTKIIRIALNSAGRQLLSSHGQLRVSLVVTQTAGTKRTVVSRQMLTLKTGPSRH